MQLDGTGSTDPESDPLTYLWQPADNLDNPSLAQPTYSGVDDSINFVTLNVYDQIEALGSSDVTFVTVNNVPPTVNALGDNIDEGGAATVRATFIDPGTHDTHSATVNWGDGTPAQPVAVATLTGAGVTHVYGDNGGIPSTVTDHRRRRRCGQAGVNVRSTTSPRPSRSTSAAPSLSPAAITWSSKPAATLPLVGRGTRSGSDDLTFTWSVGDVNTYFNNGVTPDLPLSPFGTFPFAAEDSIDAVYPRRRRRGADQLTLTDDDGGAATTTGATYRHRRRATQRKATAGGSISTPAPDLRSSTTTRCRRTWRSSTRCPACSPSVATAATSRTRTPSSRRRVANGARGRARLMVAWLQFASGAVAWDATVPLGGGTSMRSST